MRKTLLKKVVPEFNEKVKLPSGWSLYGDGPNCGLSQSMIQKFIVCRERFRIRYVEGLAAPGSKECLDFGTIFHKAWELHSMGASNTKIISELKKFSTKKGKRSKQFDPMLCSIAIAMLPLYMDYCKNDTKDFEFIAAEQSFNMKYQTPIGKEIYLKGRRDADMVRNGKLWLKENKTKSRIVPEQLAQTLPYFVQPGLYLLSLQKEYPEYEIGGFIYDIVRKPGLKRKAKETEVAYLNRIKKDIEDRPEHYFLMLEVLMDEVHLADWKYRFLDPMLSQICIWWESIKKNPFDPWTGADGLPNPHHFIRPFGIYDPMSMGVGEYFLKVVNQTDAGLDRVDSCFPELEDEE